MEGNLEYLKLPIIIDIGSSEIRAGFGSEEKPKVLIKNYLVSLNLKKL